MALVLALALPMDVWAQNRAITEDDEVLQCCLDNFRDAASDVLQTDPKEVFDRVQSVGDALVECKDCVKSYLRDAMERIRAEYDEKIRNR